ncbi:MAG: hypothetical protein V7K50_12125 [Nostoc sp.]|uniref:hypothetical protein n=1 Tax=Nostoc sp. TaxID=1180 RepID=UPI002FFCA2CD
MQLLISKCSQANGKWTDQFTRNWTWGTCTERTRTASLREAVGAASPRVVLGIGY